MYFSENYPKSRPKIFPKLFFPKIFLKVLFLKNFPQNYTKNIVRILRKIYWKFFPKKNEPSTLPGQKPRPKSHFWDTSSGIILSEGEGRDRTHPQQAPQGGKVLAGIKGSVQAVSKAKKNKKPLDKLEFICYNKDTKGRYGKA